MRKNFNIMRILRDFENMRRRVIYIGIGKHYSTSICAYNAWNRAINRGSFKMGITVLFDSGLILLYKKDLFSAPADKPARVRSPKGVSNEKN